MYLNQTTALFLVCAIALTSCAAPAPQLTNLEKEELQSRQLECDKRTAFNSSVSVLQSAGYTITAADFETGIITGAGETKNTTNLFGALAGVTSSSQTSVSVFVEEWGPDKTKVRATFVEGSVASGQYGQQSSNDKTVYNPEVYSNFFESLRQAIFVRTGTQPG
jgi:hypothetical protein